MTRSRTVRWVSRAGVVAALAVLAALGGRAWWAARQLGGSTAPAASGSRTAAAGPASAASPAAQLRRSAAPPAPALPASARRTGDIAITGRVLDVPVQHAVGSVEVVFRGAAGDATTTALRDGSYAIHLPPGSYRAFVRDDAVMSFGRRDRGRVPGLPSSDAVGLPDEALMTELVATRDTDGVDLPVVRGGVVAGRVVDRGGHPVRGAIVHAVGGMLRPALATDLALSAGDGSFELRLPPGAFELAASHPQFAGIARNTRTRYALPPGDRIDALVVMTAGCVVTGRVLDARGEPTGDGALERQWGQGEFEFAPAGRIEPDGAFHWATTEDADVVLRAWPWRSPPSAVRRLHCRDGARFDDVVFQLPDGTPDLSGVLVDRAGQPQSFGFVDLRPLDPDGIGQQERADAKGRWEVYRMPAGRYRVTAQAEGRGVVSTTVVSPRDGIRLELSGSGRLDGTTPNLASGSFELVLDSCEAGGEVIPLPQSRRLVLVSGGQFSAGDLPACDLSFSAVWRGHSLAQHLAIPAGGVARIDLALGEPHAKMVRGMVRDAGGAPVAGATVSVVRPDDAAPSNVAISRSDGSYAIEAFSGAHLRAFSGGKAGTATVGGASIDAEQLDLVIGQSADDNDPDPGAAN
jgi:hypothetical protein